MGKSSAQPKGNDSSGVEGRLMSPRPAAIRKTDIDRTVKVVIANGLSVTRIEVEGGKFVIYTNEGAGHQDSPLETWRRKSGQG